MTQTLQDNCSHPFVQWFLHLKCSGNPALGSGCDLIWSCTISETQLKLCSKWGGQITWYFFKDILSFCEWRYRKLLFSKLLRLGKSG